MSTGARTTLLILGLMVTASSLPAQIHPVHDHAVRMAEPAEIIGIRTEMERGNLSRPEAFIQIAELVHSDVLAPGSVKCFTPYLIEFRDVLEDDAPGMGDIRRKMGFSETQNTHNFAFEYLSPSGNFVLRYDTTDFAGSRAVPSLDSNESGVPDYIEFAAVYADSSWRYLVETLGFENPVLSNPYLITFEQVGYYGAAFITGNTTRIVVHRNFNGFPANLDPDGHQLGALKATIAHELKHAIQYQTNRWRGNAGNFEWVELDATMAEEVVFPTVKDYLNYQSSANSLFRGRVGSSNCTASQPQHCNPVVPGNYTQASFGLYYRERFGDDFWVQVWRKIRENHFLPMFDAMKQTAADFEFDFSTEFAQNMLWHYATGNRSSDGFGFNDRELYPLSIESQKLTAGLPAASTNFTYAPWSTRYFTIEPAQAGGEAVIGLIRDDSRIRAGAIVYLLDGTTSVFSLNDTDRFAFDGIRTGHDWSEISKIGVAVSNTGTAAGRPATLYVAEATSDMQHFRYGDLDLTGSVGRDNAETILGYAANPPVSLSARLRLASDVSGNREITAYDAALVLRKVNGGIDFFPSDSDQNGFAPETDWFRNGEAFAKSIVANMPGHHKFHVPATTADVSWRRELNDLPEDDTLRVVISAANGGFYASGGTLKFDSDQLMFERADIHCGPASDIIYTYPIGGGRLTWAIASDTDCLGSDFLVLSFRPKADTLASLTLETVRMDETEITEFHEEVKIQVKPAGPVGIGGPETRPNQIVLHANYPNPFNPATTISFELPASARIMLDVIDLTGRRVALLADETMASGQHQRVFDAGNLASGLYIVRLIASETETAGTPPQILTRKVTLIK